MNRAWHIDVVGGEVVATRSSRNLTNHTPLLGCLHFKLGTSKRGCHRPHRQKQVQAGVCPPPHQELQAVCCLFWMVWQRVLFTSTHVWVLVHVCSCTACRWLCFCVLAWGKAPASHPYTPKHTLWQQVKTVPNKRKELCDLWRSTCSATEAVDLEMSRGVWGQVGEGSV